MPWTIAINDGTTTTTLTISDDAIASANAYRDTFKTQDPISGVIVPMYPTMFSFMAAMLGQKVISPAMDAFPPAAVSTAQAAVTAAQTAAQAAKLAAISGSVTVG